MRKTIALILTITMIFSLISCAEENIDNDAYISDYTDLSGVTISESRYNSAYLDYDGNIFLPILSETADERIDRGENNSLMLLSYDQVEEITSISTSEENRNMIIDNVCGTKDGSIVGFFNELYFSGEINTDPMTGEEKDGITYSQTFFEKFAPDGEVVFRKNFSYDLPEPLTGLHTDRGEMIVDDEGYIFFRNSNLGELFVFSPDGEFLFTLDSPSEFSPAEFNRLFRGSDGKVRYLYAKDREEYASVAIDINSQCYGEETPFMKISYRDEKLLVSVTGEPFVYDSYGLYSMVDGEKTELFSWVSVAVDSTALREIVIRSAEDITVCTQDEDGYLYARITKVNGSEVPEIVTLNLAIDTSVGVRMLESFTKAAAIFNRTEKNYRIELLEYTTDDGGFTAGQKLARDISSGKRIDMVAFLGDLSYELLEKNDMFIDLYPLIDADPEISREDFLPCVTTAAEASDGGLYRFINNFYINTMLISSGYAETVGNWNIDALRKLNGSLADNEYLMSSNSDTDPGLYLFGLLMPYMLDEFINYEKRECDFTGLADLLDFCREAKINTNGGECFERVLAQSTTSDIDMLLFDMTVSLPDSEIIGYPGTDCAAGSFITPIDSLSITKYCPAPDAAWRFCRSIIDFQKKNCTYSAADNSYHYPSGLPCTWENFGLLDEQSSHYDHYVSYFTFRDGNGEEHSAYNSRYEKKGSEPLSGGAVLERTEKDTVTLKSLIASVDRIKPNDKTSIEIILEEASTYFSGIRSAEETVKLISDRVGTRLQETK